MSKRKGLLLLDEHAFHRIYGEEQLRQIHELVSVPDMPLTAEMVRVDPSLLAETEIIFSGWGCPSFTADFLQQAPNLKVVLYSAGSIRHLVSDALAI